MEPYPAVSALPRTLLVPSARLARRTPAQVSRELRELLRGGAPFEIGGSARSSPARLLARYPARAKLSLFDTTFYLSAPRQNPDLRFCVSYVVQPRARGGGPAVFARIFYKDVSLLWRSASHYLNQPWGKWIGKGAVRSTEQDGYIVESSAEETTDLPLEIQTALELYNQGAQRVPTDHVAVERVLRRGPEGRIEPYRDFSGPRERAAARRGGRINGGRPVARFTRRGDPGSLRFARGYEPDLRDGVVERAVTTSRLYGGRVRRFRILSTNQRIQYMFFAGRRQVWIGPPQATTTELMSFGVRTVDVRCDEWLCIPAFEYHFIDESLDPPALHSQIPEGFAGEPSEVDPIRADASAWLERLPVVRDFRREILGRRRNSPGRRRL